MLRVSKSGGNLHPAGPEARQGEGGQSQPQFTRQEVELTTHGSELTTMITMELFG